MKDALHPRSSGKIFCCALGEKLPTPSPLASVRLESARWGGERMFKDAEGLVQVYGVVQIEEVHIVSSHAAA